MSEELKPFQKVLVRDCENERWKASFFSHITTYNDRPIYVTTGLAFYECIPYEGNEHLLGTTDSPTPPETEFRWGDHVEVKNIKDSDWKKAVFLYKTEQYFMALKEGESYPSVFGLCRHADW